MLNDEFLKKIKNSFEIYLRTSSRSNQKLKPLHSTIARDILGLLRNPYSSDSSLYSVKALGLEEGKEEIVKGRYMDKKVDISIKRNDEVVACVGVKFIMSNYAQNSNNYFESMLGETANLRSNNVPYFQILIIPELIPYYKKDGKLILKVEKLSLHNIEKYINLSHDNPDIFMHTPNRTLICIINFSAFPSDAKFFSEFANFYLSNDYKISFSSKFDNNFGSSVILNDYQLFLEEIVRYIKSL